MKALPNGGEASKYRYDVRISAHAADDAGSVEERAEGRGSDEDILPLQGGRMGITRTVDVVVS